MIIEIPAAMVQEMETPALPDEEIDVIEDVQALSPLDMEKQELEEIKNESQKILAETEQLVMDLLQKAREEARNIISASQEEADVLRNQVFEESKVIREEAKTRGYQEGLKKAQTEIEADRQMAIEQNRQIIEEARQMKLDILNTAEKDVVRLVMAIAKKIINSELLANPQTISNIVRQAISNLDSPENVRVYVKPEQLQILLDSIELEGLNEIGSHDIAIEIKPDRRITAGGCIVESGNGFVDAQLETRINKVEESILEVVNE
jgi:flagellar biosynthesis/type III secretory pathway protein FliH